jgi:hypothetical protein
MLAQTNRTWHNGVVSEWPSPEAVGSRKAWLWVRSSEELSTASFRGGEWLVMFSASRSRQSDLECSWRLQSSPFVAPKEHPCCFPIDLDYLARMDWQQVSALGIVGVTAALFMWTRVRPRRFSFERDTHCGCSSTRSAGHSPSIVFRRRKGGRPEIVVKMP